MDIETQKEAVKACMPMSTDELFLKCKCVCIVPLDWWEKWCGYVGYYVEKTLSYPGDIRTEWVVLSRPDTHAYISKNAWKILKRLYRAGQKIEVFVVNQKPDLNPYSINAEVDQISRYVSISLLLSVNEVKAYLCQKFNKDRYWYKLQVRNQEGIVKKLTEINDFLPKSEINGGELLLKRTKKLQIDGPVVEEELIISPSLQNSQTRKNHIGGQSLFDLKELVKISLKSEKKRILIKSLKNLQKSMKALQETLSLNRKIF